MVYVMEHPKENMDDLRVAPCFVKIPASGTPKSNDWKIMGNRIRKAILGRTFWTNLCNAPIEKPRSDEFGMC
jgi:hypothetical protein